MAIMDNPEVPPAVHVRVDNEVEKDYAVRPIGAVEVTITAGQVDGFLNRPSGLVARSKPVPEEDDATVRPINRSAVTVVDGLVDEFANRPAQLVLSPQRDDK
ncbi:hypothetical protein AB0E01_00380 [Nocardia vinacea]|uniref:hypothetical protein n=1 Tax=Nocardia vinacea TaxID=96468 RepID=UPI0034034712